MGFQLRVAVACGLLGVSIGCGNARDTGWAPVLGGNRPPVIEHLRVEYDDPEAVGRLRAVAEVDDPDGDDVELVYTWTVAGVVRSEKGPELELPLARKGTRVELVVTAADGRAESPPAKRVVHLRNPLPEPEQWRSVLDEGDGTRPTPLPESTQTSNARDGRAASAGDDEDGIAAVHYAVQVPFAAGESSVRFRLLQGPEGMWIHPASGEVTWLPEAWQTGAYAVEVEISDGSGAVAVESFRVDSGREADEAAAAPETDTPVADLDDLGATPDGAASEPASPSDPPANLTLP